MVTLGGNHDRRGRHWEPKPAVREPSTPRRRARLSPSPPGPAWSRAGYEPRPPRPQQAESERDRRAKVIHAEGEFQAAGRLRDAAEVIEGHPMAMQMRFLQTLSDLGTEKNTTIVFPVPIDLLSIFTKAASIDTSAKSEKSEVRALSAIASAG